MQLRPAGTRITVVFDEGVNPDFIKEVEQSWGALEPVIYRADELPAEEALVMVTSKAGSPQSLESGGKVSPLHPLVVTDEASEALTAERLTVEVTLKMLEQLAGDFTLFHAAALGDASSKSGMILVGPSGRGKTTASRFLGKRFIYLSDETAVIDRDYKLRPYPKPLSLIVDPSAPKVQVNPQDEGMQVHDYRQWDLTLRHLIMLNRTEGVPTPYLERVGLADALLGIVSETSGLEVSRRGLSQLNDLINHCGGVLRLTYTEISDTLPLLEQLLSGEAQVLSQAWEAETIEVVAEHTSPPTEPGGMIQRAPSTSVISISGRYLFLTERSLLELSDLALLIWDRLEEAVNADLFREELMAEFGEIPREEYDAFIEGLRRAKVIA